MMLYAYRRHSWNQENILDYWVTILLGGTEKTQRVG